VLVSDEYVPVCKLKNQKGTSNTPTSDNSRPRLRRTRAVHLALTILALFHPSRRNKMGACSGCSKQAHKADLTDSTSNSLEAFLPCQHHLAAAGYIGDCGALKLREWSIGIASRSKRRPPGTRREGSKEERIELPCQRASHWRSGNVAAGQKGTCG
jgi:hypothetical protein